MPDRPLPVPSDDLSRRLTIARPDEDQNLPHIRSVVADRSFVRTTWRVAGPPTQPPAGPRQIRKNRFRNRSASAVSPLAVPPLTRPNAVSTMLPGSNSSMAGRSSMLPGS
jgi:hypothetical protein